MSVRSSVDQGSRAVARQPPLEHRRSLDEILQAGLSLVPSISDSKKKHSHALVKGKTQAKHAKNRTSQKGNKGERAAKHVARRQKKGMKAAPHHKTQQKRNDTGPASRVASKYSNAYKRTVRKSKTKPSKKAIRAGARAASASKTPAAPTGPTAFKEHKAPAAPAAPTVPTTPSPSRPAPEPEAVWPEDSDSDEETTEYQQPLLAHTNDTHLNIDIRISGGRVSGMDAHGPGANLFEELVDKMHDVEPHEAVRRLHEVLTSHGYHIDHVEEIAGENVIVVDAVHEGSI